MEQRLLALEQSNTNASQVPNACQAPVPYSSPTPNRSEGIQFAKKPTGIPELSGLDVEDFFITYEQHEIESPFGNIRYNKTTIRTSPTAQAQVPQQNMYDYHM